MSKIPFNVSLFEIQTLEIPSWSFKVKIPIRLEGRGKNIIK